MILAVGVGWRYAPSDARERLLGFIGVADRVNPARIAKDIKDRIVPEDPTVRRAALVGALKQKIQEIKADAQSVKNTDSAADAPTGAPAPTVASAARATDIASAADEAAQLVNQLEQSGGSGSVSGQVFQRVLDNILPTPQCKN